MGTNHLKKSLIPKNATNSKETKYINKSAAFDVNINETGNDCKVFVSLKHLQYNHQCFSEWSKMDMTCFWRFNESIHEKTWQMVQGSSGKGKNKTGLAYTVIAHTRYPDNSFKKSLSKDITLFELRLNDKIRVHGFRSKTIFYICWLDREHNICP